MERGGREAHHRRRSILLGPGPAMKAGKTPMLTCFPQISAYLQAFMREMMKMVHDVERNNERKEG
jgi:hypothetical protein